jgi:CubicO group peptidase (beta-lactamase class C family)
MDDAGAVGRGVQDPVTAQVPSSALGGARPAEGRTRGNDGVVTLSNWQRAPFNRWSFRHVAQLVPSARVERGEGPVLGLPPDPVSLDDVRFQTQSGGWQSLGDFLTSTSTDGFVALRGGRVAAEIYFEGMTPSTRHLLHSVSKSLCGTVAGALIGTGVLRADDLVTDHVPEFEATSFEDATVRHLLDMTAGTRFSEDYDDPAADVRAYERAAGWQPAAPGEQLDLAGYVAALPNERGHGELFEYRSILTDVLGLVLERAGRAPLAELTSRLIWRQMGAEYDAEVTVDRAGNPMADGGFSVTLRDLARLGQLWLQGGCVLGRQIVPYDWVGDTRFADDVCRRIFLASPEAARALCPPLDPACEPLGHYRNQWWVLDPSRGTLLAAGIYGQYLYIDISAGVVLAKLSSLPDPLDLEVSADSLAAFAAVTERLASAGD